MNFEDIPQWVWVIACFCSTFLGGSFGVIIGCFLNRHFGHSKKELQDFRNSMLSLDDLLRWYYGK